MEPYHWVTRIGSCIDELSLLALVVVAFVAAARIKRSIGAYVFGVAMLVSLGIALLEDLVDALKLLSAHTEPWFYAFAALVSGLVALMVLASMALILPRAPRPGAGASAEASR